MSILKATEGPYKTYRDGDFPGIDAKKGLSIVIFGFEDEECGVRGRNDEEALANAYLFAASWKLYHALENILNGNEIEGSDKAQALEALAEARGEPT